MPPALTPTQEWRRGWRVVLGAAIGSGLGIPLLLFLVQPVHAGPFSFAQETRDFGVTRGEMANYQALIVAGALSAPLIGRTVAVTGVNPVTWNGLARGRSRPVRRAGGESGISAR